MQPVMPSLQRQPCTVPLCQADIALLSSVASLKQTDPRMFFSKAYATQLIRDVKAQADRVIVSTPQGVGAVSLALTHMLNKHGGVFVKPFSFGAAHDGVGVVAVSQGSSPGRILVMASSGNTVTSSVSEFATSYCAAVSERSVNRLWQVGIEETITIYPKPESGARELRFLLGADPHTGCPKVYGCYGRKAKGHMANVCHGAAIVDANEILDEITRDPFDKGVLLRRCQDLALDCSRSIAQNIGHTVKPYPQLALLASRFPLTPRHLCVDVVITKRQHGLVEPVVMEVQYPPGPSSDRGIKIVDPRAHRLFSEEFETVVARDVAAIQEEKACAQN
jgi:hypothetical protein